MRLTPNRSAASRAAEPGAASAAWQVRPKTRGASDRERFFILRQIVEERLVTGQIEPNDSFAGKSRCRPCDIDVRFRVVVPERRNHHAGMNARTMHSFTRLHRKQQPSPSPCRIPNARESRGRSEAPDNRFHPRRHLPRLRRRFERCARENGRKDKWPRPWTNTP